MTTARAIINRAYRENNLVAVGTAPTDAEAAEALVKLNNIIEGVFGVDVGEFLMDWPTPPAQTSPTNQRYPNQPRNTELSDDVWPFPPPNVSLLARQASALTVYLDPNPSPGAQVKIVPNGADFTAAPYTVDANGRLIAGELQLVIDEALTAPLHYFYRDDLASWTQVSILEIDDEMPFPSVFDDYFTIALNARVTTSYAKPMRQESIARFIEVQKRMDTHYRQRGRSTLSPRGPLFNTVQTIGGRRSGHGSLM